MKDITTELDTTQEDAASIAPLWDGLKKVAKRATETETSTKAAIIEIKTETAASIGAVKEQIEKGIGDVLDRVETLSKRTSVFGRLNVEQDDLSAIKEALPDRFKGNMSAYERETIGTKGLFSDPRGLASAHAWFALSTKLQMRSFDRDREKNQAEFTKLNDRMESIEKTALDSIVDAQGGYTVPNIVGNEVLKLIRDASDIYTRARQVPMTSDTLSFPDEATAVVTYWSATNATTLTAGEPVFGVKTLTANKLIGRATFSLELLDDANVAIVPFLQACFTEKMGGDLDSMAMEGTYAIATMPFTGVLNATSVTTYTPTTNGTNGVVLKYTDMVKMFAAGGERYTRDQGIWVCGPGVYANIIGMTDTNGNPIVKFGTVESAPSGSILGRPLIVSNRMGLTTIGAGTNSVGNLYFGPPSALLFGVRQGMRWDVTDQVSWATYRADARMVGRFGYVVGIPTAWVKATGLFAK